MDLRAFARDRANALARNVATETANDVADDTLHMIIEDMAHELADEVFAMRQRLKKAPPVCSNKGWMCPLTGHVVQSCCGACGRFIVQNDDGCVCAEPSSPTTWDALISKPKYSAFAFAVQAALSYEEFPHCGVTVFAPTNDAWYNTFTPTMAKGLMNSPELLRQVVKAHIVPKVMTREDFQERAEFGSIETVLDSQYLSFWKKPELPHQPRDWCIGGPSSSFEQHKNIGHLLYNPDREKQPPSIIPIDTVLFPDLCVSTDDRQAVVEAWGESVTCDAALLCSDGSDCHGWGQCVPHPSAAASNCMSEGGPCIKYCQAYESDLSYLINCGPEGPWSIGAKCVSQPSYLYEQFGPNTGCDVDDNGENDCTFTHWRWREPYTLVSFQEFQGKIIDVQSNTCPAVYVLTDEGRVYGWGKVASNAAEETTPFLVAYDVKQISVSREPILADDNGVLRNCAVFMLMQDGTIQSFGDTDGGQLGRNGDVWPPAQVGPIVADGTFIQVTSDGLMGAALTESGEVWMWGTAISGELSPREGGCAWGLGENVDEGSFAPFLHTGIAKLPGKVVSIDFSGGVKMVLMANGDVYHTIPPVNSYEWKSPGADCYFHKAELPPIAQIAAWSRFRFTALSTDGVVYIAGAHTSYPTKFSDSVRAEHVQWSSIQTTKKVARINRANDLTVLFADGTNGRVANPSFYGAQIFTTGEDDNDNFLQEVHRGPATLQLVEFPSVTGYPVQISQDSWIQSFLLARGGCPQYDQGDCAGMPQCTWRSSSSTCEKGSGLSGIDAVIDGCKSLTNVWSPYATLDKQAGPFPALPNGRRAEASDTWTVLCAPTTDCADLGNGLPYIPGCGDKWSTNADVCAVAALKGCDLSLPVLLDFQAPSAAGGCTNVLPLPDWALSSPLTRVPDGEDHAWVGVSCAQP
eukprot:TRINITY_DN54833_c0_g1_i1.p1 TRINITY_DN54833_c0_g1~~TRINITY_DN54833_c0_g1_i1.p1  ORF type:complete len:1062 (+),score=84.99 TRINITY_DN54833_c0_g1_i1:438-3188(+)